MSDKKKVPEGIKMITENRRARFDYALGEKWEAGLVLMGSEVKSLRNGDAALSDAFAQPERGELWLHSARIGEYKAASMMGHTPLRSRKLLLHRRELEKIIKLVKERGVTIVPTKLYFKDGRAKVEIAIATGKTHTDRREDVKERESKREISRALRGRR